jgi:hypothetical protein
MEQRGQTAYALDIGKGGSWGDDMLTFAVGQHRGGGSGINGWAEPYYDKQAERPKLKLTDFSVLSSIGSSGKSEWTAEELFQALWDRIIDDLERT